MPLPPKPKKKPDDFALLLEAEPASDEMGESEGGDEFGEDDEFSDLEGEDMGADAELEGDPLAAESEGPEIDREQALLAETLGFTEPDQQRALIDLIKLVAGPGAPPPASSSAPSTLESGY